ncbi:MAG TPA: response regulator transcription factor [Bryobacteraceae bacterium]
MPSKTRILLIDDHALFREAIAGMLSTQPDFAIVGEAATIDDGLRIVRSEAVDLVLLDIDLGLENGRSFVLLARSAGFQGKILVVTAGITKVEATALLHSGCAGILLKQERPALLMERIRAIAEGEIQDQPATAVGENAPGQQRLRASLTPRERAVFRGVFKGGSNKEIATELGISEAMVKAVVQQLFRKAEVRSRGQLVRAAIERFWKDVDDL